MKVQPGRTLIGRIKKDQDLLEALTQLCQQENIRLGSFTLLGSVTAARVGYYNQVTRKYIENIHSDARWEILSCLGNISLKDSESFIHAHIILSDDQGHCYGGHLMPGTKIFSAEYCIRELTGGEFLRKFDEETGLLLWGGKEDK
jgi:hypothetical protein